MTKRTNTIDLETAKKWAKRWRKEEGNYNAHHELHAFLIPKIDLEQLLEEDIDAVRGYLGVDDDQTEKLMLVGTKYDPVTDIYKDMTPGLAANSGYIYDYTRPCPPNCDPTSPLN